MATYTSISFRQTSNNIPKIYMNVLLEHDIVNKILTSFACFSLYSLVLFLLRKFYVDSQSRLMKIFLEEVSRLLV